MKLYTFEKTPGDAATTTIGAELDRRLVDLPAAHAARVAQSGHAEAPLPADMLSFIRGGAAALATARLALDFAEAARPGSAFHDLRAVRLRAPIARPGKVLCSGINYHGHFRENPKAKMPDEPFFFAKVSTSVCGPGDPIVIPRLSKQVDWEVELTAVIGKPLSGAPESAVRDAIFGYTILHDVSARDVQFKDAQITLGKNFAGFAPTGPCIVTADAFGAPEKKRLRTLVNGEAVQDGSTEDWVFPLPRLIAFLSQVMPLEPGDLVTTGTPAGVGYFRQPQRFLAAGDRVVLEVEGIGRLENPVVAAQ
jgi:2-keto-4-pentenoate hydratase/2-oxohepta-3-ene-1,7-dioic acid hydratase in catechol pathway